MKPFRFYTVADLVGGRIVVGRHYTREGARRAAVWARRSYRSHLADPARNVYVVNVARTDVRVREVR